MSRSAVPGHTGGMHDSPERQFRRFRENGDPTALAAVFDACAPRLLLVAAHVTPDAAAAEDLLQDTFLTAMGAAAQWDPARPLQPWLCGILRHRALHLARQVRRRATAELPAEPTDAAAVDPAAVAASAELLARVEGALGGLPSPYREALVLRLVHGLEPTAIAHALGRPPGTVRVQLRRGIDLLRAALPTSLAGSLALLLGSERGLAATRAAVLGSAGAIAGRSVAAGVPLWWLAVALSVVVGAGWWFVATRGAVPVATPSATPATVETPVAAAAPNLAAVADRELGAVADAPVEAALPPTILRGRLVAARDRVPLPNGVVTADYGRGRFMTDDAEFRRWPDAHSVRTGVDGTFAIEVAAAPERRVFLSAVAPGHVEVEAEWISLKNGLDVDLGDLALADGVLLQPRVVDAAGAPVPGVRIEVSRQTGGFASEDPTFAMWSSYEVVSDGDGWLEPRIVPAPGRYEIEVSWRHPGYRIVTPTTIELDLERQRRLDVVVEPAPPADTLRGHVVDVHGRPVGGVSLLLYPEIPSLGMATSAADGSFWLAIEGVAEEVLLHLPTDQGGYRLLEPERSYARGAAGVVVRVEALPRHDVELTVVDTRSGAPVEWFGLRQTLDHWWDDNPLRIPPETFYFPARAERHPEGRAVLRALWPGRHALAVFPRDRELAPARLVSFEVQDTGAAPLRVELQPFAPLTVLVQDADGAPVADATVQLVHGIGSRGEFTALFTVDQLARGVGGGQCMGAILGTATTDATGRVVLPAPAAEDRLWLRVFGACCAFRRVAVPTLATSGGTVTIATERRAQLVGRVEPVAALAPFAPPAALLRDAAIVREMDPEHAMRIAVVATPVDGGREARGGVLPDGAFALDAVPPGDLQLAFEVEWMRSPGWLHRDRVAAGTVAGLRAGERRELVLSADVLRAATVRGQVSVDGVPWTAGEAGLVAADGEGDLTFAIELGADGGFTRTLPAGTWLPFVSWSDAAGEHVLFAHERLALAPGTSVVAVRCERRALRLELARADGAAAAGRALHLRCVGFPEAQPHIAATFVTDATGVCRIDPAPPGLLDVSLRDGDRTVRLGEIATGALPETVGRWVVSD